MLLFSCVGPTLGDFLEDERIITRRMPARQRPKDRGNPQPGFEEGALLGGFARYNNPRLHDTGVDADIDGGMRQSQYHDPPRYLETSIS